ncbi:hypothetical protein C5167_047682 [Papaver somniferum]|uniref:Mur ligase central domain-containing protein n=1 Tax=Papaver somniferum TaxID=3469 RepID=A0A4Y7LIX3_PAPSO|nr:dihydrofolate synthetase-like [Papaver somniferum]RZC84897.1 hypothetical protein C5167_047682 [Papaver somniferum]
MKIFNILHRNYNNLTSRQTLISVTSRIHKLGVFRNRRFSTMTSEEPELKEFTNYLDNLKNYERSGVPGGAGTDSDDGFDMGRMNRLMKCLGNPQSKFKSVHIAGTKGKGSTAMFLSNILRQEGYSVGCYTSPHLWSIRERILLGRNGEPVSAKSLNSLFLRVKDILDRAFQMENGSISHFEVFTAVAFTLFAQENVDIAVVEAGLGGARDATNVFSSSELLASIITTIGEEHLAALGGSLESIAKAKSGIIKQACPVVFGGPFEPQIESILYDKASSMGSPIVSASAPGNRSSIKEIMRNNGKPYQICDILIDIEKDLRLSTELFDVRMPMVGSHQLQNAVTATCAALSLREQGWRISDESIRVGLEHTCLTGRSQFLTPKEADAVGLAGTTILVDGAHTKESARSLTDTIQLTYPDAPLALVVAMANDKDHLAFAKELLSGSTPDAVILTEVSIAGGSSRLTPASKLKECWVQAATELGVTFSDIGIGGVDKFPVEEQGKHKCVVLGTGKSVEESMNIANQLLRARVSDSESCLIAVTGSLHIVSSLLAPLQR